MSLTFLALRMYQCGALTCEISRFRKGEVELCDEISVPPFSPSHTS